MKNKILYITTIFLFCAPYLSAQNVKQMMEEKPFTIHGSIGGGMNFFSSNEPQATRDPFTWNLHANLTPSIYGFSLPFAFSMTQYTKSYSAPFSRFGISPSYKWVKLHLGYRTISFSPLVFNGQSFLGAGVELHPGNLYFAAFYGRLNKAISEDTTVDRHIEPQFARRGFGIKAGIKEENKEITLQYFHAKDDMGSIHQNDSTAHLSAQANSVLGTSWKVQLFNMINFRGNVAVSLLNQDLGYGKVDSIGSSKVPSFVSGLLPITYSTVFSWSGQTQLSVHLKRINAMLGYRRIEPDFKSLGVPYMLNDREMFNGNVGTHFFDGKITVNAGFTSQHNNLNHNRNSTLSTTTGNFSANAFVNQHFNISMNLTGVNVYQKDGQRHLTDSTRMNQLMLSLVLAPSYNFYANGLQHNINLNLSYTNLNDKNPLTRDQASGKNVNLSTNYSLYFSQKGFGVNSGIRYSKYKQVHNSYSSIAFNVGANTQLLKSKALYLQGNIAYLINKASNSPTGNNITFSLNSNYHLGKHHSFGAFVNYVITPPVNLNPMNEIDKVPYAVNSKILSGGVTYSYNF